jgi:hypothetical protein
MSNLFIARFLARCALIGARRCSSAKHRVASVQVDLDLSIAATVDSPADPGQLEARASRVRQHKLLRVVAAGPAGVRHGHGLLSPARLTSLAGPPAE